MRIHITGGPGTGKTTLARALAAQLAVDHFELDGQALTHVAAQGGIVDFETLAANRVAESARIAAGNSWISEGSNVVAARPFLELAEVIVVLYSPWRVASYRILLRHLKANLSGNNRFPGIGNLYRFWRWSARYHKNRNEHGLNDWGTPTTQIALEEALQPYESKLVRCATGAEIEHFKHQIIGSRSGSREERQLNPEAES